MKGRPVEQLVYEYIFPKPKPSDPCNFQNFLQRNLIPEVRQETHAFYGHLDTQEAKYPGLDYTHKTHRIRLSRWPWHRRLFRALDGLGLTNSEIAGLTKWEGTRWAKEKFEREQGITIRDTAADGFPDRADIEKQQRLNPRPRRPAPARVNVSDDDKMEEDEDESEDELESSVGVTLNERLRAQAARRDAGESSVVLDEEWEQWLKNAIESGELALLVSEGDPNGRGGSSPSILPPSLFPPSMLTAARAGLWHDIPESLQPVVRRTIEVQDAVRAHNQAASSSPSALGTDNQAAVRTATLNATRRMFANESSRSPHPSWLPYLPGVRDSTTQS
ncbi:hypothetical protein B0I35DRAFT_410465 [Stachybotrys elegans]|uniref:Uncharacterized protein n=1 Tax=Stachybotrys elegans TaxID=80388 RepID=A0A8K0SIR3_9HYPO|nr:hypothetical protein B0I35DRAFT_410465 [Stachybotrys elegans]